ncbi:ATP-binding protein [Brachyspira hyodysenteriae]|uniref:AAA family ATPase n=1 Tax=Brachyspira hyodysenteriae TaxID=159 RepID=UPI0022CDD4E0|nr:AAA family ATPase [Brachyspira hyodysenteriae]MCZ9874428.1 ATP-binding protein [Brachyspira hyodysenteriae]
MSYSKLIIKNFGKIKEAEIELSNLILFIGDNNSGKSYLMTLIYGLMKYSDDIVNIIFQDKEFIYSLEEYKEMQNIVTKYIKINENINHGKNILNFFSDSDNKHLLSKNELNIFYNFLNQLLNKYKTEILQIIFNDEDNVINLESIYFDYSNCLFDVLIIQNYVAINKKNDFMTGFKYENIDYIFLIKNIISNILQNTFYDFKIFTYIKNWFFINI